MSFGALINPTFLEAVLEATNGFAPIGRGAEPPEIRPVPYELDESWKNFEKELGAYKRQLTNVRRDLNQKYAQLLEMHKSSEIVKMILDNVPSDDLKARIASVVDNYESDVGSVALTQQCGELKGKFEAMSNVLDGTNAERYDKFTCFICQDRLVDLFIDPCGHVVCDHCWVSTRDKSKCPGCRTGTHGSPRKIYVM